MAVREVYQEALAERGFVPDAAQLKAVDALERCEQGWIDFYAAKKAAGLVTRPLGGNRIALLAFGVVLPAAEAVAAELGLSCVNMRFVKPLDRDLLLELARSHEGLVTLEDNAIMGGAGSGVAELLASEGIEVPLLHLGLPDSYLEHASREDLLAQAGLDVAGVRRAVLARWPELGAGAARAAS